MSCDNDSLLAMVHVFYQLRSDIARCSQDGQSIATYYRRLKTVWDELSAYIPLRRCNCGGCRCAWAGDLGKERKDEQVHQFLMGLDDEIYGTVRSNIPAQDPLPSLTQVYALAIQEEWHREMVRHCGNRTDVVSFAISAVSTKAAVAASSPWHKKPVCGNCGKQGHEDGSCFKLIEYPDWWGDGRGNGKVSNKGRTSGSGGRGRGFSTLANVVNTVSQSTTKSEASGGLTNHDRATLAPVLTNEQWGSLLNMFKQCTAQSTSSEKLSGKWPFLSSWILDTGASHHMTGNKSLLLDLKDISSSTIGLPNGFHTKASQEGIVLLDGHVKIPHVLYVT